MRFDAVCIGECMIELRREPDGRFASSYAGDSFNTAVAMKRAAPALNVGYCSATSVTAAGDTLVAAIAMHGVDTSLVFRTGEAPPGLYAVDLDDEGERTFQYWRSASPARQWWRQLVAAGGEATVARARLVYLSGISLAILPPEDRGEAIAWLGGLRDAGIDIAFDPNIRPALWQDADTMRRAIGAAITVTSILLPSSDDLTDIDVAGFAEELAITHGAGGASVGRGDNSLRVPVPSPVVAVDTSGAGDAFNGAYLAARLSGQDPLTAARTGIVMASHTVLHRGAIPPAIEAR